MVTLLLDTCIWLTLASDRELSQIVTEICSLVDSGKLRLLLPDVVEAEFLANRDKIETRWTHRAKSSIQEVRALASTLDPGRERQALLDSLVTLLTEVRAQPSRVAAAYSDIQGLFTRPSTIRLVPSNEVKVRASDRCIRKEPPCHEKNQLADAIILEALLQHAALDPTRPLWFVTSNHTDFSDASDHRNVHSGLASAFSEHSIQYANDIGGFLNSLVPASVSDTQISHVNSITAFDFSRCPTGGYHEYDMFSRYSLNPLGSDPGYQYRCRKCGLSLNVSESGFDV